jgi:DNA-binding NarL/FixJ family response regulator
LTLLSANRHDRVTPILAKLDVKSRSAATDYAHRHDLA